MRSLGMKKSDWIGVIGVLVLLLAAPGYLAQDPGSRALGAWQDFELPPARIGDRFVFDLVVQTSDEDPRYVGSVLEVVHRAPTPDEVPVEAVFVQEVRFFPHHANLSALHLRQNASVLREYYDDEAQVVWRALGSVQEVDGTAYASDHSASGSDVRSTTWFHRDTPQRVVHEGDAEATADRLILQSSVFLYEQIVMPQKIGSTPVRDRMTYGDLVLYGGPPIVPELIDRMFGMSPGRIPCMPADPHTYVGAGGMPYTSPVDNPMWREPVPRADGQGFEPGPMFPGPLKLGIGTDSVVYWPERGWEEPRLILPLGPHQVVVDPAPGVGFCQGGEEHLWYHPDVPFAAGYHITRDLRPAGERTVQVDLLPSTIVRGTGARFPDSLAPPRPGEATLLLPNGFTVVPQPVLAEAESVQTVEPRGPRIRLSTLGDHDAALVDGRSLADLDGLVRGQTNVSSDARLVGFAYDRGDATRDAVQWWLLYARSDGTARVFSASASGDELDVTEEPCSSDPYKEAWEHHLYLPCRTVSPTALTADPLVIDPRWAIEQTEGAHAFSYEPLATEGAHRLQQNPPLAFVALDGDRQAARVPAEGGAARWTTGHVGPAHGDTEEAAAASWGTMHLRDGVVLEEVRMDPSAAAARTMPASAIDAGTAPVVERAPITTTTVALSGLALIVVASLIRFLAAAKTLLLYPSVTALYARIEKDDVRVHERRELLMQLLEADPGLTPSAVDRKMEWGWGATVHHLETLRKNGQLVRMQVGRSQHYFPLSIPDKAARLRHVVLRSDDLARFLELVESEPGLSLKDIDDRTTLKRPTLSKIGSKLVAYGLVRKERDGKRTRFYPAAEVGEPPSTQDTVETEAVVA